MYFNRNSCTEEPFQNRVQRILLDRMKLDDKVLGVDPIPDIPRTDFIAPRGIDLIHSGYVIMDGLYYSFLYIKADGYSFEIEKSVNGGLIALFVILGLGVVGAVVFVVLKKKKVF